MTLKAYGELGSEAGALGCAAAKEEDVVAAQALALEHAEPDPSKDLARIRAAAMRHLAVLDARGEVDTRHVRLVAELTEASERTVWRWLKAARAGAIPYADSPARTRKRYQIDEAARVTLAYWRGNAAAAWREICTETPQDSRPPSRATFYRAIGRDLTGGQRAGLREGERAMREHSVFLKRPPEHRNSVWETDHTQLPIRVDVEGNLRKPWLTWFIDTGKQVIMGAAVTPGYPNRESILTALRAAILTEPPYGPAGGLPTTVRVDRGLDFLAATVKKALGAFAVTLDDLPAYSPHLKGTVEGRNKHIKRMLIAALPGFTRPQTLRNGKPVAEHPPMLFEPFTGHVFRWIDQWNREHTPAGLDGLTPLEAWLADPTPIDVPSREDLRLFTMEDDNGRVLILGNKGVRWRKHDYVDDWMEGKTGLKVRIRHMLHHEDDIEIFDAATLRYLGPGYRTGRKDPELVKRVKKKRAAEIKAMKKDLRAAERRRAERYAPVSEPAPPRLIGQLSDLEAELERGYQPLEDLARLASPAAVPRRPMPAEWVRPRQPGDTA